MGAFGSVLCAEVRVPADAVPLPGPALLPDAAQPAAPVPAEHEDEGVPMSRPW